MKKVRQKATELVRRCRPNPMGYYDVDADLESGYRRISFASQGLFEAPIKRS